MKYKFVLVVVVLSVIIVASINTIEAQDASKEAFNQAFNNYSLKNEEYNSNHEAYVLARSQYLKFKTLASKTNAQTATANMLKARDDVVTSYLLAIKARINDSSIDISSEKKDVLFIRIDTEVGWFNDHKANISESDSLDDLISKSDEAKVRFKGLDLTIYDSLYSISGGRMLKYRERFNDIYLSIVDLVNNIKNEKRTDYSFSDEKLLTIDRWITETQDQLAKCTEVQLKAEDSATRFGDKANNKSIYDQSMESLENANTYLKDAAGYTQEIISEIKIAE